MDLFEQHKVTAELDERLRAAGIDPSDAKVKEISSVISKYFAERTAEVLQRVQEVLDKVSREELH
jgi:broad specificity phosphatase PhoE